MTFPKTVKLKNFIFLNAILVEKGAIKVIIKNYSEDNLSPKHQIIALFDNNSTAINVKDTICTFFNVGNIKIGDIENKDWKKRAIDNFSLINIIDKLYIHPKWKQPSNKNIRHMIINSGISFGSGKHSTTILCLEWIAQYTKIKGCDILDYGCGTGILAISSLLFGANSVIATDIDPNALKETQENAKANNISKKQLQIHEVDKIPSRQVDILFANLYFASALITLHSTLSNFTKIGGLLLLSGFQSKESNDVEKVYSSNFNIKNKIIKNDWVLLVTQRHT
jgi:ribosomal protein L11 methyltransferase